MELSGPLFSMAARMQQICWHFYETERNVHFMNEMNMDWDDLRLFLAVARGGRPVGRGARQRKKRSNTGQTDAGARSSHRYGAVPKVAARLRID
jgi:hypothetical protein